jgi:hypothetical protein
MRAIVAVGDQEEMPLPEPAQQHTAKLSEQAGRHLVPAASLLLISTLAKNQAREA